MNRYDVLRRQQQGFEDVLFGCGDGPYRTPPLQALIYGNRPGHEHWTCNLGRYAAHTVATETSIDVSAIERPPHDDSYDLDLSSNMLERTLTFVDLDLGVLNDNCVGSAMQCYCGGVIPELSITSKATSVFIEISDKDRVLDSVSDPQKRSTKRKIQDI